MPEYYVGTLSGTSADGIDVVLVDFAEEKPKLIAAKTYPMPDEVRSEIRALSTPTDNEIERLGRLDVTLGRLIAEAVNELLAESGVPASEVVAIGSHGQTLRHRPYADPPFTLQVGDSNTIAARTGLTTVSDFRRMDIALGGQGAPLASLLHEWCFRKPGIHRCVVNLGGIANVTLLPGSDIDCVTGFDSGPGNCLMDEWAQRHLGRTYDADGAWASKGAFDETLLEDLLQHPYLDKRPPKSTGREEFNLAQIDKLTNLSSWTAEDVQATLAEYTAVTLCSAIRKLLPGCSEVYVCGGGAHNLHLLERISRHLGTATLANTDRLGIPPDWIEGVLFAWLAYLNMHDVRLDSNSITGAAGDYFPGSRTLA